MSCDEGIPSDATTLRSGRVLQQVNNVPIHAPGNMPNNREGDNLNDHEDYMPANGCGTRYFRDVHEALPKFDPVAETITIDDWIDKIEEYGILYNWDNVAIRHYALLKLDGVAKKWRDSLPAKNLTWNEWKEVLIEAFPPDDGVTKKRMDAQNYKRKPGQNMVEYFYEKLARCNKAKMSDQEIVEWMILGIENMKIREYIGPPSRYEKPSKLLSDLKSAERFIWFRTRKTEHSGEERIGVTS